MFSLTNKVAIVTGAASGLGKEIAILYATQGAKVIAADYNEENLNSLKEEVSKQNFTLKTVKGDISKQEDVTAIFEMAMSEYGQLDILVNNAGVMDNFAPIGEVEEETWNKIFNINVHGTFLMMQKAIQIFEKAQRGVILNISSIAGLEGTRAGIAYTASKHAINGMTKNTGFVYAKSGIRCNAIAPGGMNTNITSGINMQNLSKLIQERVLAPAQFNPRSSDPKEVANLALFLASDEASFVNGAIVVADGGWTAY